MHSEEYCGRQGVAEKFARESDRDARIGHQLQRGADEC